MRPRSTQRSLKPSRRCRSRAPRPGAEAEKAKGELDVETPFVELRNSGWKEAGELEGIVAEEDEEVEEYDPEEDGWQSLGVKDGA